MKLRGEDGTREACSATCPSPASRVAVRACPWELPNEQPAGRLQLGPYYGLECSQLMQLRFGQFIDSIDATSTERVVVSVENPG